MDSLQSNTKPLSIKETLNRSFFLTLQDSVNITLQEIEITTIRGSSKYDTIESMIYTTVT